MYIPVGTVPSSLDELVGDLERRQARGGAASVKSVSTNNSGANSAPRVPVGQQPRSIDDLMSDLETRQIRGGAASVSSASSNGAQSVQSNNTNSTGGRGRAPAPAVPAPRVPVGQQPRSIDDLMSDLETRQIRGDAASVSSAATGGGRSVQSANTNSTRGGGRAQPAPAPAPAPRVPIGQQPRSIDELVADLETRQIRGDAASVASASTGGAQSVQSANTNSTRGARRPAPPARIPVGSQPRSIDELLSDLETRQVRGDAASVASVSTNGRSVQSANTNPNRGARRPAPPARIPVGAQPRSVDELLSDLERRQVRGGGAASVSSVSTNGRSVQSANTNSTRGARQPALPPAQPAPPPARIPIGAQPRSLAELVGDLERRQVAGGDAASVSSVSSKKSNKAKSVKSTKESSGAAPAPTATSSALPQPPAAEPTSSAPAIATTPAANPAPPASSSANPVQNPAVPLSSTAVPVAASPSPTTLLTRVSSSPGGGGGGGDRTALPDLGLSSSSTAPTAPVATVLPPASELPSGPPPSGGSANSEMGLQGGGGAPMGTSAMVGIIFGSVLGLAVVAAFLFVCCVRRRRAKAERESQLAMAAAAAQYPDEKGAAAAAGKRPVTDWEDRLYGSADRTTGAGFSDRAKSIFVVPWKFISGNRGGQQPPPPPPPAPPSEFPQLPLPPKLGGEAGPASTRYSKRSTGLTTLDETQFTTYNNLVGRSNPKKPVAFDNPYFQKDEWK